MPNVAEYKIITCLLPEHKAISVLQKLFDDKGIITANKSNARGSSFMTHVTWIEMEILEVVVTSEKADEIYDYLFNETEINAPHGGLIFQHKLSRSSHYQLPHL